MRSYGQACPIARALDAVGDRWSLLVVRELLIGECRFRDLREGLPGVATNLLADRLRDLRDAGVVEHDGGARGAYRLTPRGRELAPVLDDLAGWGAAEVNGGEGRARWVALYACGVLGAPRRGGPLAVELATPDGAAVAVLDRAGNRVAPEPAGRADVRLRGEPAALIRALRDGSLDGAGDVTVEGSAAARRRLAVLPGGAPARTRLTPARAREEEPCASAFRPR